MKLKIFICLLYCLYGPNIVAQNYSLHKEVLKKNQPNQTFKFGNWDEKGNDEIHLTYLGSVKTKRGNIFKILNSVWIWGQSKRATSRIIIFNSHNKYVGNYYVTTVEDLPSKLKDERLIFKNCAAEFDYKLITKVNLKYGLPHSFYRKCTNDLGDIYTFE